MAPEEAADPAAQPAAPAGRRKSRKERTEKPEAGEGARRRAAGRRDEIEGLTRAGRRALALGDAQEAVGRFRQALLLSGGAASPRLRRACAFNLGAAYVETGEPERGLEFLLQSRPAEGRSGARSRDLYFSVRAARQGIQDFPKALEHFGKAAGPAGAAQAGSRAGTRVQMGCCYLGMREPARAACCFLDAARTYEEAASPEAAAVALSRASGSMLQSRRFRAAEIAAVLAQCRLLCESIPDPALRGNAAPCPRLAAPWGAAPAASFSPQENSTPTSASATPSSTPSPRLPRASSGPSRCAAAGGTGAGRLRCCRTWALPTTPCGPSAGRCAGTGERRRCTVGRGGISRSLGFAGCAGSSRSRAVPIPGALGNRRAQGQCFGNLAYACSQLRDHEAAAENYLHALQAFRDVGEGRRRQIVPAPGGRRVPPGAHPGDPPGDPPRDLVCNAPSQHWHSLLLPRGRAGAVASVRGAGSSLLPPGRPPESHRALPGGADFAVPLPGKTRWGSPRGRTLPCVTGSCSSGGGSPAQPSPQGLSPPQDTPRAARERVVHKLTVAIQQQLCLHGRLSRGGGWGPAPARVSITPGAWGSSGGLGAGREAPGFGGRGTCACKPQATPPS